MRIADAAQHSKAARVRHDAAVVDQEAVPRGDRARASAARLGPWWAADLREITDDPARLDAGGRWVVLQTFEGAFTGARFGTWSREPPPAGAVGRWSGPDPTAWRSSMDAAGYTEAVGAIRSAIGRGDVYQVNLCRILTADLPDPAAGDVAALHELLARGNPAPYQGWVRIPGAHVATASPELFLSRRGSRVRTGPIKGTGRHAADLREKDRAENVMIVDLMRNDLAHVCRPGTIVVPALLTVEPHPGLVHLVSYVEGDVRPGTTWPQILAALTPPGSVSGAPKISAVSIIERLEPVPRGPYCGVVGWVDADTGEADLAVGIRTFWVPTPGRVSFGTGAGITWQSDPAAEWAETDLKAARLLDVAAGRWPPP